MVLALRVYHSNMTAVCYQIILLRICIHVRISMSSAVLVRIGALCLHHLLIGYIEFRCQLRNRLGVSAQAEEIWIEVSYIRRHRLRIVPPRINGNQKDTRSLKLIKIEALIELFQLRHRERADIWAVSKTEEDQIPVSLKIGLCKEITVLIQQAEIANRTRFRKDSDANLTQFRFALTFTAKLKQHDQGQND